MRTRKRGLGIIIGILLCMFQSVMVSANSVSEIIISKENIQLENGDCLEVVISEPSVSVFASGTRTGSKTVTYKANGVAMWYVKVTGKFSYTGNGDGHCYRDG